MKKVYIITGAFGHLGVNLVKKLLEQKEEVIAFDLRINNNLFKKEPSLTSIQGDICNKQDLEKLFSSLKEYQIVVIHCAAIVTIASKYNQKVHDHL